MDLLKLLFFCNLIYAQAKYCEKTKVPFELGEWASYMKQMDSATIENKPVSSSEGQVYVYENTFPGYTIRYVNVDNVAQKTCGARASLKRGGVGSSTVLIVLHATSYNEIRSVIDVWGTKDDPYASKKLEEDRPKFMKSRYLFKNMRAVSHNSMFFKQNV